MSDGQACGFAWKPKEVAEFSGIVASPVARLGGLLAARERAMHQLTTGLGLLLLGALITGVTYLAAGAGGTYVVMSGAFVFGGGRMLIGAIGLIEARRGLRNLNRPTSPPQQVVLCSTCRSRVRLGESHCPNCMTRL